MSHAPCADRLLIRPNRWAGPAPATPMDTSTPTAHRSGEILVESREDHRNRTLAATICPRRIATPFVEASARPRVPGLTTAGRAESWPASVSASGPGSATFPQQFDV